MTSAESPGRIETLNGANPVFSFLSANCSITDSLALHAQR